MCCILPCVPGCLGPSAGGGAPALTASPNPSEDGAYTVSWAPLHAASRYRLYENGVLSYEGSATASRYSGMAAGEYTYSLTYCVSAFGIEACDLGPVASSVTVIVSGK